MPDEIFKKLKSKITPAFAACLLTSFVFGFAAHFYRMTNWLPNWESLVFREDPQHMESLGRWFLSFASSLSTDYELPWLCGLICLLFFGLGAAVICKMFGVEKKLSAVLIGALTVTFPAVTSTFTYCYVSDAYALSFLLACLGAYFVSKKGLKNAAVGVGFAVLSLGIYQAYITVFAALLTARLIMDLLCGENAAASLKKAGKYIVCAALAVGIYAGIFAVVCAVCKVTPSDYQELSNAVELKNLSPLSSVASSLYIFWKFFVDFSTGINAYSIVNLAFLALLAVGYSAAALSRLRGGRIFLWAVYSLSIPFGCSALYFANPELDYHSLMKMSFFIVYIYAVMLYEKFPAKNITAEKVKAWAVLTLCSVIVYVNICTANVAYHKLQMAYEKSYGILMRISDRIESLDGYEKAKNILVVGWLENSESYSVNFPPEIVGTTDGLIIRHDDEAVGQSVLTSALNDYSNISLDFLSGETAKELKNTERVKSMSCFPADGSVDMIGDTVVVKLCEETD